MIGKREEKIFSEDSKCKVFFHTFTKNMAHAFATVCAKSDIVIMCDTNIEVSNYYDRKCQID